MHGGTGKHEDYIFVGQRPTLQCIIKDTNTKL